ncbi:MAG: SDR family oxidoreductase [Bacteroidota bacterium]|nr:SDR family oxidoreductase [Bacteroidota bacterium]
MNVLVAGANGNTGRQIVGLLIEDNHTVRAMIRDAEQASEFEKLGAEPVIADLEQDVNFTVLGCDAVIFAAGSGPDTGSEKTKAVDRDGAIKLIEACEKNAVNRFIMLSSVGADNPDNGDDKLKVYLEAKADADKRLQKSHLNYTIIRPVKLNDEAEAGKIDAKKKLDDHSGEISRTDVASVIVEALDNENTYRKSIEITKGQTPIGGALSTV